MHNVILTLHIPTGVRGFRTEAMLKRREREEVLAAEDAAETDLRATCSDASTDSSEGEHDASDDDTRVDTPADIHATRKKIMILSCRGINAKQRHLLDDLCALAPHMRRESKYDDRKELGAVVELADLHGASHVVLFEPRKPFDLFMWIAESPSGPSMRFQVLNIHTLDELALPGNCMRGTRPILTFDPAISAMGDHGVAIQKLLGSAFSSPAVHRKVRPFIDRVMHFALLDGHIWVRNYQMLPASAAAESAVVPGIEAVEGLVLSEIGPRMVLQPVRLLEGAFRGRTLWLNPQFVPRSAMTAAAKSAEAAKHMRRAADQNNSSARHAGHVLPRDELADVFD